MIFTKKEKLDFREHVAFQLALVENKLNYFVWSNVIDTVVIGQDMPYNCYIENNIHSVPLARYMGGGGPVFFTEGTVMGLVTRPHDSNNQEIVKLWFMKSMKDLGLECQNTPKNDVLYDGKKIFGAGVYTKDAHDFIGFFVSFQPDYDRAGDVMVITKHGSKLSDRAIGINNIPGVSITQEDVLLSLKNNVINFFGESLIEGEIPEDIIAPARILAYNEDWIKHGRITEKPDFE